MIKKLLTLSVGLSCAACGEHGLESGNEQAGEVSSPLVGGTPVSAEDARAVNFVIPGFSKNVGSGGLVTNEWVLTARHVVEDALELNKPIEIQLGDFPAPPKQRRALKSKNVIYHPDPNRDVALVRIEPPFITQTSVNRDFIPPPTNPVTCVGYGSDTTTGANEGQARSLAFMLSGHPTEACKYIAPYPAGTSRLGGGGGDSGSVCTPQTTPNSIIAVATNKFDLFGRDEFEAVGCFGTWAQNVISAKAVTQLDFDGDGLLDNVRFYVNNGTLRFRVFRGSQTQENAEANTTIPFSAGTPLPVVAANFNLDTRSGTSVGCDDVAIVAQGKLWPFLGNCSNSIESRGSLGFTGVTLANADLTTTNSAPAVEAVASTGEVVTFSSFTNLGAATASYGVGFPTGGTNDGEMMSLSGVGFDTVSANVSRLKVSQATQRELDQKRLKVEVFDGEFGGTNDGGANNAETCYQLLTDPCGDLAAGDCSLAANSGIVVSSRRGADMTDNGWATLYDGANDTRASIKGTSSGPFSYMVRSFLADPGRDCASAVDIPSIVQVAGVNVFKVRANALVSRPADEVSFWGVARTGQWGASSVEAFPATNFEGVIDLKIAGSLSGTQMLLEEFDADDTEDSTPGVAMGANSDIRFWVNRPDGTRATVTGGDYPDGTEIVENPSGNFNSDPASPDKDIEKYSVSLAGATAGTWTWHWEGVGAHNNIKVNGPFGSPTTYELLGAAVPRAVLTSAQPLSFWTGSGASSMTLPVVLGSRTPAGAAEGDSLIVTTQAQAQAILNGSPSDTRGRLIKQLLGSKLNVARAGAAGERLENATVYGTTEGVDAVLRDADAAVRGPWALVDATRAERLSVLLNALNQGDVNYLQPGVPPPSTPSADDDGDGFINLSDNCPSVANPTQADADADLIGDACAVVPRVECILPLQSGVRVYFGYTSPLSFRRIPVGRRNNVSVASGLPVTVFQQGSHSRAFSLDVAAAASAVWNVNGVSVAGSASTPHCGGSEVLTGQNLPQLALFGTDSVQLADSSVVEGSVLSGGYFEQGARAVTSGVRAKGNAFLRSFSTVHGPLVTSGSLSRQQGSTVEGAVVEHGFVGVNPIAWQVAITGNATMLEVGSGATVDLPVTGLRAVSVRANGTLRISAGTYRLDSLQVETGGRVIVDDTAGPVTLYVRSSLFVRGAITRTAGTARPASAFLIGYFGTSTAFLEVPYRGSFVAPLAGVALGPQTGGTGVFEGQWFAKTVELRPSFQVRFAD